MLIAPSSSRIEPPSADASRSSEPLRNVAKRSASGRCMLKLVRVRGFSCAERGGENARELRHRARSNKHVSRMWGSSTSNDLEAGVGADFGLAGVSVSRDLRANTHGTRR